MREGKENKKYKQKARGRKRSQSILCINKGSHLEVILNTLHETPLTPTAFVAGDECKAYICCNVGWPLMETASPWPKPKTFFSLLPTKDHLNQSSELCPFHLKVFRRLELRNGQLCSLSLTAQWWLWLMSYQGMCCVSCWDTPAFPNFSQGFLLLLFFKVGTEVMRI